MGSPALSRGCGEEGCLWACWRVSYVSSSCSASSFCGDEEVVDMYTYTYIMVHVHVHVHGAYALYTHKFGLYSMCTFDFLLRLGFGGALLV